MKKFFTILFIVVALCAVVVPSAFAQGANPPADNGGFDIAYISELLQALILATVPVLFGAGAKWLVEKAKLEKAKIPNEQLWAIEAFARTVIYAAEQMHVAGFITDKLDYATGVIQGYVNRRGFQMDIYEIRAVIEAAVKTEINYSGLLPEKE